MRCFFFVLISYISLSNVLAAYANVGEEPVPSYSNLDKLIEEIAVKHGREPKAALEALATLEDSVFSSSYEDIAYFLTYRCYLQNRMENAQAFKATQTLLFKYINESARNPSILSANALCEAYSVYSKKDYKQYGIYLEKAYQFGKNSSSPILRYWINMAYAQEVQLVSRHTDVIEALSYSKEIADKNNDEGRKADVNSIIAISEAELGFYEDAIKSNQSAIQYYLNNYPQSIRLLELYQNRGYILLGEDKVDEAEKVYEKALDIAIEKKRVRSIISIYTNQAAISIRRKNYDSALALSLRTLKLAQDNNQKDMIAHAESLLASSYAQTSKLDLARVHYQSSNEYFKEVEQLDALINNYATWSQIMEELERYQDAYDALKNYNTLQESYFKKERNSRILHLKTVFDSAEKDRRIQSLSETNLRKEIELENQALQTRIYWLVGLVSGLVLVLLLIMYRRSRVLNESLSKENVRLDKQRFTDPLTKCFNRRYYDRVIQKSLTNENAGSYTFFALDIDHFKNINDTYGHSAGDKVLQIFAQRIQGSIREDDKMIRLGGEEFLLIVKNLNHQQYQSLSTKLLKVISESPIDYQSERIALTVSIGISTIDSTPVSKSIIQQALEDSDKALYHAKENGRNRACLSILKNGRTQVVDIRNFESQNKR